MCKGGSWKREVVPDHKFDFVDTREFRDNGCGMRSKYMWLYVGVFISFLVYISDIFTATTMLLTEQWSNPIQNSCPKDQSNGCVYIPFSIGRWLFFGCVVFSFLLLSVEAWKARKIVKSRDISYAFTNVMANHYYSLRSYDHFCLFNHISASTKRTDDFAFFVFFTFKSWKRLLFADGPRQTINALTLYAFYLSKKDEPGDWYDPGKYINSKNLVASAVTISTTFTVCVFIISLLSLIVAGICYIPLLAHIQGNLKEYCCYKVDKRIAEIIRRRKKQRLAKAAALAKKEAAGDYSHLKNKKGEFIAKPLPQPTLPNLSVDDVDDSASIRTRGPPGSTYAPSMYTASDYYGDYKGPDYPPADYPPMPGYSAGAGYQHQYRCSVHTLPENPQQMYDGTGSGHGHGAYVDMYRSGSVAPDYRAPSAAPDYRSPSVAPDYRAPSAAPDYRAPSAAPDYRAPSAAPDYYQAHHGAVPDYRSPSAAPDYRSPSTAPYGYHHAQYSPGPYQHQGYQYQQAPYSPQSPQTAQTVGYGHGQGQGQGQGQDPYAYQAHHPGQRQSMVGDYDAGEYGHAM